MLNGICGCHRSQRFEDLGLIIEWILKVEMLVTRFGDTFTCQQRTFNVYLTFARVSKIKLVRVLPFHDQDVTSGSALPFPYMVIRRAMLHVMEDGRSGLKY